MDGSLAPPKHGQPPPPREVCSGVNSFGHSAKVNGRSKEDGMGGLRSEDLCAENPLGQAHSPAHSEVGVGRGRRPDLSFVRRRQAL